MVIIHNNKTEIVDNLEDCLNLAYEDNNIELIKASASFVINEYEEDSIKDTKEDLESEIRDCIMNTESREICLREVLEVTEELKNKINESKRLNRDEILYYLKSIINKVECEF